jgi:hypothetical protein
MKSWTAPPGSSHGGPKGEISEWPTEESSDRSTSHSTTRPSGLRDERLKRDDRIVVQQIAAFLQDAARSGGGIEQ